MAHSVPVQIRESSALPYTWKPRGINVWETMSPLNPLQKHVYENLKQCMEGFGCQFSTNKRNATELGPVAHLGVCFGRDLDEEVDTLVRLGALPKPRGLMLCIMTVERIPDDIPRFDVARMHIVRKASQILIMVEGDPNGTEFSKVLWGSMPGNNVILTGTQEELFDMLAVRVLAHGGADKVNKAAADDPTVMSWAEWAASPVHADIAYAAHAMGDAGLIEEEVPLEIYASSGQVHSTLRFLNRAAMGEGMRSQLDLNLGVMGITASGGNKISVSADPAEGHVIPISQLTKSGYVRAVPENCPAQYTMPSVETHENGMVYLAGSLINAGVVDNFNGFLGYLEEHFSEEERIDIIPDGMTPRVTALEHFHRQPVKGSFKEPERVEVVYPDNTTFPEIDFPCGVREAEYHLLSALFQSRWFTGSKPLGNRIVIAVLPGHGSMAVYNGPRREMMDLLINGMEMEDIIRV